MIWFTADTHFGHGNIIKYCNRPYKNTDEMNRCMTELWNSRVGFDDIVIHCGDFANPRCKDPRPYLKNLNGKIILIRGNHDKRALVKLMDMSAERLTMRIGEFRCIVNHRPVYPKSMRVNDVYNDHDTNVKIDNYDFVISGHIHEKRLWSGISINVGVDVHHYAPISCYELEDLLCQKRDQND